MKALVISIIIAVIIIVGSLLATRKNVNSPIVAQNNVSIVDGVQIIDIYTKGGYQPQKSTAKAGVPTIIRFTTKGTFDCSSAVRIPSLKIGKNLPQTGTTDINIGTQKPGFLQGTCSMGMYSFAIEFTN